MKRRRLLLLAVAVSLTLAGIAAGARLSGGPIEGHLASQAENTGNSFGAAASFEAPGGGG